jgi:hypothetical protein
MALARIKVWRIRNVGEQLTKLTMIAPEYGWGKQLLEPAKNGYSAQRSCDCAGHTNLVLAGLSNPQTPLQARQSPA